MKVAPERREGQAMPHSFITWRNKMSDNLILCPRSGRHE